MANENTILTRLTLKIDTYANWTLDNATTQTNKTHANLVLMRGEIGLCEIPEPPNTGSTEATTAPTVLFKVGDGTSPFKSLKWASAKASDVYDWAKQNALHTGVEATTTKQEVNGEEKTYVGNAVTAVEWDSTANGGKGGLKFTKGTQFATKAELDAALAAFGGDLAAITDNNTVTTVELVTEGTNKGKIAVTVTTNVNGVQDSSTTTYLDIITPDELETILEDYVESVNKVDGTAIEVVNTDPQNPKVGFKIDATQGDKVTVTQSNNGLKVQVDLSDYRKIDDDEDTITIVAEGNGIDVAESVSGDTHTYTVSHQAKPTSGNKETNATTETAATTFVTGVKVDDFGHVAGVTTAEVVVPDIDYQEDTTATVPTTDTIDVVGSLSVNNNNNKHNLIEDAVQVATAEAFTYRNTEKPINTVGGISSSTDMSEITFKEFVTKMLYPYTKPTVGKPTVTITKSAANNNTVYEVGETPKITKVSATVTKKSEPIAKVELLQGSTVLETRTTDVASGGTINFTLDKTITSSTTFTVRATDTEGGVTTSSASDGQTFAYPYYYGVCSADQAMTETFIESLTKNVAAKGTKTYTYTTAQQCMVIAYPKSHGALTSAKDPNNFEILSGYTRSEVSITGLNGTAQTYYVYKSGSASNTGFKVIYTH